MRIILLAFCLVCGLSSPVSHAVAALIPIQNASFEDPYLDDNSGSFAIPGWTVINTNPADTGIETHIVNPNFFPYHSIQIHGRNILSAGLDECTFQTLAERLQPETTYTLQVNVGNPQSAFVGDPGYFWGGYRIQLLAGNTLLAEDFSSLNPSPRNFLTSIITYSADEGSPALGQFLRINLMSLGRMAGFDDVRLDSSPAQSAVPLPPSVLLLGTGLLGLIPAWMKAQRS